MILRHCKACTRDRRLSNLTCSCGSVNQDSFKAVIVIPGSRGKRKARTCLTLEAAVQAERDLKWEAQHRPVTAPAYTPPALPHEPANEPTFDQMWQHYHSYSKLRKRSWKVDVGRYNLYLRKPLSHLRASQIRVVDVQSVVDGCLLRGLKPATAMQAFALVRVIFNHADRMELTEGLPNPCKKVQPPKFDNKINNPPTPEDFAKLVETCNAWKNQHAARVVLFCAYSGRRMGEVLKLEWADLDLPGGMVCFKAANTKSGKTQTVPVNEKALEVLQRALEHRSSGTRGRKRKANNLVFPCSTGKYFSGFHAIWQRIRRAAKMSKHYRFHDLRHGFASTLVSNGVSLYMVKELLGHADIKTTERYAHLATGALREAAGVMCLQPN